MSTTRSVRPPLPRSTLPGRVSDGRLLVRWTLVRFREGCGLGSGRFGLFRLVQQGKASREVLKRGCQEGAEPSWVLPCRFLVDRDGFPGERKGSVCLS